MKKAIILLVAVLMATISFSQSITFWSSMSGPIGGRADTVEHIIDIGLQGVVVYNAGRETVYDLDYLSENFHVTVTSTHDYIDLVDSSRQKYRLAIYSNSNLGITHMILYFILEDGLKTVSGKIFIK